MICVHHYSILQNIPLALKIFCVLPNHPPLPQPLATTDVFTVCTVLPSACVPVTLMLPKVRKPQTPTTLPAFCHGGGGNEDGAPSVWQVFSSRSVKWLNLAELQVVWKAESGGVWGGKSTLCEPMTLLIGLEQNFLGPGPLEKYWCHIACHIALSDG